MELRDPITWTVLHARTDHTANCLPSSNAGRCAALVGIIVLLLLVLPWYAKGHKNKTGVVAFPQCYSRQSHVCQGLAPPCADLCSDPPRRQPATDMRLRQ